MSFNFTFDPAKDDQITWGQHISEDEIQKTSTETREAGEHTIKNTTKPAEAIKRIFDEHLHQINYKTLKKAPDIINQIKDHTVEQVHLKAGHGWLGKIKAWWAARPLQKLLEIVEAEQAHRNKALVDKCAQNVFEGAKGPQSLVLTIIRNVCESENRQAFSILTDKMKGSLSILFSNALKFNPKFTSDMIENPNQKDASGKALLQIAIEENNESLVLWLLDKGANPNQLDPHEKNSMLIIAEHKGNKKIADILRKNGAELYPQDESGRRNIPANIKK